MERANELSGIVIKKAFTIHSELGPGLLESAYEKCLFYELDSIGLSVKKQIEIPLIYKNISMGTGYRADLIVEDKLILEIKSVDAIINLHVAQTLTYLKLSRIKLGLILNFNVFNMRDGIKRIIR